MYQCPVCGYLGLTEKPYTPSPLNGYPLGSDEICPSCGFQFGFNERTEEALLPSLAHERYRAVWVQNGCHWWSKSDPKPIDWNPEAQLASLLRNKSG